MLVPQNKKQIATGPLLDRLRTQDFAGLLSSRASRVLGQISRYRVADILLPGLLVGFLRILCDGLCTAQRLHTEEHDHTCRIGCPNEPASLSHCNECPRLSNFFVSFWRHATILPQREIIYYTTWSLVSSCKAFNMELWYWVSLTPLFLPIISIAKVPRILEILVVHERKDSLHDGHHSCLCPRVSGNVACTTLSLKSMSHIQENSL